MIKVVAEAIGEEHKLNRAFGDASSHGVEHQVLTRSFSGGDSQMKALRNEAFCEPESRGSSAHALRM